MSGMTVTISTDEYTELLQDQTNFKILMDLLIQNTRRDDYHHGYSIYNIEDIIKPFLDKEDNE